MPDFVQLTSVNRRELIRGLALGLTAVGAGSLDLEAAQHVHDEAAKAAASGPYKPKALTAGEFSAVERLAEIVVPKDDVSGSAKEAGAGPFIDLLCSQNQALADIYHGGLAWFDAEMNHRVGKTFLEASAAEQTGLLDALVAAEREENARRAEELVYRKSPDYKGFSGYTTRRSSNLGPGVKFFDWVRKMSIDAFYTSPMGVKDVGYVGNRMYSKYEVPQAAIDHALSRSPGGKP